MRVSWRHRRFEHRGKRIPKHRACLRATLLTRHYADISFEVTKQNKPAPPCIEITAAADGEHYTLKETGHHSDKTPGDMRAKTCVETTFKPYEYVEEREILGAYGHHGHKKSLKTIFYFLAPEVLHEERHDPEIEKGRRDPQETRYELLEDGTLKVGSRYDGIRAERIFSKRS